MRSRILCLVAVCGLVVSCSSATDVGEYDAGPIDYSLFEVDGGALPGPFSSLPGLLLWEGGDGSILTVASGELGCGADGAAAETYLFRLSRQGSATWDPIRVNLALTCEPTGAGSLRFEYPVTGEQLVATVEEMSDGCSVVSKELPSLESLRSGYSRAGSGADFPGELELSGPLMGVFVSVECTIG